MMESEDFKNLVPDFVYRSYIENLDSGKISDIGNLDRILLYKLRMISAAASLAGEVEIGILLLLHSARISLPLSFIARILA